MNHSKPMSSKESQLIKDLDNLLKCGICYEYFKTTLITPCSHNYCSICIRQSLLYRNQCPSCFEETNESQLRTNRVVDNIITIFVKIKDNWSKSFCNSLTKNGISNNSISEEVPREHHEAETKIDNMPSSSKETNTNAISFLCQRTPEGPSSSKKELRIPPMFSPKKQNISKTNDVKVSCPVCKVEIPERNINIHLDVCLKRSEENRMPRKEKRNLLPKLVYNLLADKDLRKKLADLGLSAIGDRKILINRHKRYTILYNSECDSLNPRPVADLIKQLKKEEEEEKKASTTQVVKKLNVDRKADARANEEAQRQYLQEHKYSFLKLIEEAKRNRYLKKTVDTSESKEEESKVVSMERFSSSEPSEAEFAIKRPSYKRRLITSDSESDEEDEIQCLSTQVLADVHSLKPHTILNNFNPNDKICNKENDKTVESNINIERNKTEQIFPEVNDLHTDDMSSREGNSSRGGVVDVHSNNNENLNDIEGSVSPVLSTLHSSMSPILPSRMRGSRTPSNLGSIAEKRRRDLSPDLFVTKTSSPSFSTNKSAGQESEDDVDSDTSSNHSTSIMMYSGPGIMDFHLYS